MYHDIDDELFLAPESTVSLHFDAGSADESEDWGSDHSDVLAQAESDAWARHAARSNGFGEGLAAFDGGSDDRPTTLRDAIRLVMELP
jgi:hypothetical protein